MITAEQILPIAEKEANERSCFIVDIKVNAGNKIVVLIDSDKGVSIDDCVALSRSIENGLDRESEDFELNVMSAGITEPFKILRQYIKNVGKEVEVTTIDQKKIKGFLLSADKENIVIETKTMEKVEGKKKKQFITGNIQLKYNQIKSTKLVISF